MGKPRPTTPAKAQPCPRCMIGRLQACERPYTAMMNGMLFSVPHVPAGECDVCGYTEFNEQALIDIGMITGDLGLAAEAAQRAAKRAPLERDDEGDPLPRFRP